MGRKYASIHIYGGEQEKNLLSLKDFCNNNRTVDEMVEEILRQIKDPEKRRLVEEKFLLSSNVLIVQSKAVLSIYDEDLSFETVEERAKALSKIIDNPVIYTSNFDEDIFIFGIYRSGRFITGRKMGEGLSDYDILPEALERDKFSYELSLDETVSVGLLETSKELEELEEEMEKILEAPLDFFLEDVRKENEQFTELSVENQIHVFKRYDR